MVIEQERQKMNEIFSWFEENKFENNGVNSREMNLIFEFADWIDTDEGLNFICDEFGYVEDVDKAKNIQSKFSYGINSFLNKECRVNYPFLF